MRFGRLFYSFPFVVCALLVGAPRCFAQEVIPINLDGFNQAFAADAKVKDGTTVLAGLLRQIVLYKESHEGVPSYWLQCPTNAPFMEYYVECALINEQKDNKDVLNTQARSYRHFKPQEPSLFVGDQPPIDGIGKPVFATRLCIGFHIRILCEQTVGKQKSWYRIEGTYLFKDAL